MAGRAKAALAALVARLAGLALCVAAAGIQLGCASSPPPPPPSAVEPPLVAALAPPPPPPPAPAPPVPMSAKVERVSQLFFERGQAGVSEIGHCVLADAARRADAMNLQVVIVTGHADAGEGNAAGVQRLATQRAEAVAAFLVGTGIAKARVYTEGKGAREPADGTGTAEARASNRRVVIEMQGTANPDAGDPDAGRTMEVLFATNRMPTGRSDPEHFFGSGETDGPPDQRLRYGRASVSVPPCHRTGVIEEPGLIKVTLARVSARQISETTGVAVDKIANPDRYFVFTRPLELFGPDVFADALAKSVGAIKGHQALLYVHGYANSFAFATYRAAQLAYDLAGSGVSVAPVLFSWPSDPQRLNYAGASERANSAAIRLAVLLRQLSAAADAGTIHIVAHSRGAQVLGLALRELGVQNLARVQADGRLAPNFNQIVLAAPDIRAHDFEDLILPAVLSGHHVTSYISGKDMALQLSKVVNDDAREGLAGNGQRLVRGVDSIDITRFKVSGSTGHSTFADSPPVVHDIALVLEGTPPSGRSLQPGARPYLWDLLDK